MSDVLDGVILLPWLRVQNANTISGPLTWGFPAITAFAGFAHALHRKLGSPEVTLGGVGVVCHSFQPQTYQPGGRYHRRFNLPRHPMGKDGQPVGTVEEGRAHMTVSLLLGVRGDVESEEEGHDLARQIMDNAMGMRLAGGSLMPGPSLRKLKPQYIALPAFLDEQSEVFKKLRRKLLPGFALVDRSDLLAAHLEEMNQARGNGGEAALPCTALDALLDLCQLKVEPEAPQEGPDGALSEKVKWKVKVRPGWLAPIPVGYGAISPLYEPGQVRNTRDRETPFRFVEALYSLGQWVSPHRLDNLQTMMWRHAARPEQGLYLCQTMQAYNA